MLVEKTVGNILLLLMLTGMMAFVAGGEQGGCVGNVRFLRNAARGRHSLVVVLQVVLKSLPASERLSADLASVGLHLLVNVGHVALQVSGSLEGFVAVRADEVVALVDAADVVVEVWLSLELLAAPVAGEGHLVLVDDHDVVLHAVPGGEALAAEVAGVGAVLQVHHLFVIVESVLQGRLVAADIANVWLGLLVHRVSVGDEGGLLSGLVVAEGAGEALVVQVDDLVVGVERLLGLELLAAGLADVHLGSFVVLLNVVQQVGLLGADEVAQLAVEPLGERLQVVLLDVFSQGVRGDGLVEAFVALILRARVEQEVLGQALLLLQLRRGGLRVALRNVRVESLFSESPVIAIFAFVVNNLVKMLQKFSLRVSDAA